MKSHCKVPINTFNFVSFVSCWNMFYKPLIRGNYDLPMQHRYEYYWRWWSGVHRKVLARIHNSGDKITVTLYVAVRQEMK